MVEPLASPLAALLRSPIPVELKGEDRTRFAAFRRHVRVLGYLSKHEDVLSEVRQHLFIAMECFLKHVCKLLWPDQTVRGGHAVKAFAATIHNELIERNAEADVLDQLTKLVQALRRIGENWTDGRYGLDIQRQHAEWVQTERIIGAFSGLLKALGVDA